MKRMLILAAIAVATRLPAQTITEYRWWVNDDVSTLVAANLASAADLTLAATLNLPAMGKDYNTITFQFRDSNGEWSSPQTTVFGRSTGDATGYEYWIDDNIGASTSGSLGPNAVVDLMADLPTGVPAGTHTFTIRFSSANGTWSVPLITEFNSFVSVEELPGLTDLILFPNPVADQLGLRLSSDASRTLSLQVLDISGALVLDLSTWGVRGTALRNWDISDLASGSYLLRISDGNGARNLPFVKP